MTVRDDDGDRPIAVTLTVGFHSGLWQLRL